MSAGEKGSRRIYDKAGRLLADADLSEPTRNAVGTAKNIAALSALMYQGGRVLEGAEAKAIAQDALFSAEVQTLLPDAERGAKVAASARAGHEAVHGTDTEKAARWRTMANEYRAAVAAGAPKTLAREAVAKRHGVHAKTVQRAAKKF